MPCFVCEKGCFFGLFVGSFGSNELSERFAQFQSRYRAVTEQLQSSYRAVVQQFKC